MQIKEHMLDYVITLLLCRMEQGKIKSWLYMDKIDRIHRAHAQCHAMAVYGMAQNVDKPSNSKTKVCLYYNKGSCSQKHSHETKGVLYKHVCLHCWKEGKAFPHTQVKCRKR